MHETCSCIEKVINNYVLIKRSYGLIYWKAKLAFATKVASAVSMYLQMRCLFEKALPEPDFRYFSKRYALYLSGKTA